MTILLQDSPCLPSLKTRLFGVAIRGMCTLIGAVALLSGPQLVQAQTAPSGPELRDAKVDSATFKVDIPAPNWVKTIPIAQTNRNTPPKGAMNLLLADSQFRLDPEPIWFIRRVTQLNDASALNPAGTITIDFVPEYNKIQVHHIRVNRAGKTEDRLGSANIRYLQRERGLEQGMYSGVVTASVLLRDIQVGDQIDFAYSIIGENPVFGKQYASAINWDSELFIEHRYISLSFPESRPLSYQWTGDGPKINLRPKEFTNDQRTTLVFEAKDLESTQVENYYPSGHLPFRFLQVSEHKDWNSVGRWAHTLFNALNTSSGKRVVDPKVAEAAARFAKLPNDEAKVSAVLNFVQSDIRYFSVSLGESSHRPADPATVLARRYGDCKDKTQLLIAMLHELGIEAKPALISIAHRSQLDRWQPSPIAFDHVVARVKVGDKFHYLDPTRLPQSGQLDRMGQGLENHQAFVVEADGGRFERVESPIGKTIPLTEVKERMILTKFGDPGQLEMTQLVRGAYAENLRAAHARGDRAGIKQWLETDVTQRFKDAKIQGDYAVTDNPLLNEFSLTASFVIPKMMAEERQSWFMRVTPPNVQGIISLPQNRNRTGPFGALAFPFFALYSLDVQLPESVAAPFDPVAREFKNKYFHFTSSRSFRGSRASLSSSYKILTDRVAGKDFSQFVDELDKAMQGMPSTLVVDSSIIKSTGLFAKRLSLKEQLEARYGKEAEALAKAIASGQLNTNDMKEARLERAHALLTILRLDEAQKEADELLKTDANDANVRLLLGNIHFARGKSAEALVELNRSVRLDPNAEAFYRRGMIHFRMGNWQAAAEDLDKSGNARQLTQAMFPRIWQAWALRRLNQPRPASFEELLAAVKPDQWPHAGLLVATRATEPESMLKAIESLKGEERDMALAEAYYYIGQEYLLRGDPVKAKSFFEKCVAIGAIHYIEHSSSLFELDKLK